MIEVHDIVGILLAAICTRLVLGRSQAIAKHDLKEMIAIEAEDAHRIKALACERFGNVGPKAIVASVGEFVGSVTHLDNRVRFHSADPPARPLDNKT
jgi:hypothetical protein